MALRAQAEFQSHSVFDWPMALLAHIDFPSHGVSDWPGAWPGRSRRIIGWSSKPKGGMNHQKLRFEAIQLSFSQFRLEYFVPQSRCALQCVQEEISWEKNSFQFCSVFKMENGFKCFKKIFSYLTFICRRCCTPELRTLRFPCVVYQV